MKYTTLSTGDKLKAGDEVRDAKRIMPISRPPVIFGPRKENMWDPWRPIIPESIGREIIGGDTCHMQFRRPKK